MNLIVHPGQPLHGELTLPGDKSLSHRAALFAGLARGESRADNFLVSGVTAAMLRAMTTLGVAWSIDGTRLTVHGRGLEGLRPPSAPLDCGNSATTLRLLAGAMAAAGIPAGLDGSAGLRRRPMDRIVEPLNRMCAAVSAGPGGGAPLQLAGRPAGQKLRGIDYILPVASAQVKTCLMLAALAGDRPTTLIEPALSRDHSERMLASQGVEIEAFSTPDGPAVRVHPPEEDLLPLHLTIPGDFSAAAFLMVAAVITPGSQVFLRNIGLNPTRTGLLVTLREMGASIEVRGERLASGEPAGDLSICHSPLHGVEVKGARVVEMIDEFPVFAAAAAFAHGRTVVRDAAELRYKESDRIGALCAELRAQGVEITEQPDGFIIEGKGEIAGGAPADPHGDHRLAMALAVLGLSAKAGLSVRGAEIMGESFPEFGEGLHSLGAHLEELP